MPAPAARRSRTAAVLIATLAATTALTACDDNTATVTHIVDGDTIDVERDGEEIRVRLLNVDTPESTDPDVEPECLGPEATDFLESLIPVGTEVQLETDEELEDGYGRLLAGVYLDGTLVNAEIARAGLGVAVVYEPNERFYDEVLDAQKEARTAERGLYDPAVHCTVPGQVDAVTRAAEDVAAAPADGAALTELETYTEEVAVALAGALALEELLDGDRSRFPLLALSKPDIDRMQRSVSSTATDLTGISQETERAIGAEEARLAAAEEARRAAEQARKEEEARREAEEEARRVAEQAEREAAAQAEREAAERRRQAEAPRAEQPARTGSSSGSSSSGSSGGSNNYTGCRAYGGGYAPNATDDQGRPYTKIDCTTKTPIG